MKAIILLRPAPALPDSGAGRTASPLLASAEHFDTCGDSGVFGQKWIPSEKDSDWIRACKCKLRRGLD